MTPRRFALTWDYRCPYARIAHDHVVTALEGGAPWEVRFLPFSLAQAHVEDDDPDVWDEPDRDTGLLALRVGVAVRDQWPSAFLEVHRGLFDLRHVHAGDLRDRDAIAKVLVDAGLDADEVLGEAASARSLATVKAEHTEFVTSHKVWGVPTFIVEERAVFVRLLDGPRGDAAFAQTSIERVLDEIDWPLLNEFKHTSIPR